MKRTVVKKVIIVVVVLFLVVMGVQVLKKLQHKEQVQQALAILPEFSFCTLEGASFTNAQLPQNNKIVFIYFNTECEYCFYETKDISEQLERFKATTLLLVSNEKKEAIKAFAIKQNLQDKSQVIFLQDSTYTFAKQFEANSIPYILAYDAQGKLLLRHKGQLRAEKLLQLLDEK
jgi:ahpC/TSA family